MYSTPSSPQQRGPTAIYTLLIKLKGPALCRLLAIEDTSGLCAPPADATAGLPEALPARAAARPTPDATSTDPKLLPAVRTAASSGSSSFAFSCRAANLNQTQKDFTAVTSWVCTHEARQQTELSISQRVCTFPEPPACMKTRTSSGLALVSRLYS